MPNPSRSLWLCRPFEQRTHIWSSPWRLTGYSLSWDESRISDLQGKDCYLGTFADPVSAAIRYNQEATKLHGEDPVLNVPPGGTQVLCPFTSADITYFRTKLANFNAICLGRAASYPSSIY
jgi:hypothetical protein